jgi:hypothetical protein
MIGHVAKLPRYKVNKSVTPPLYPSGVSKEKLESKGSLYKFIMARLGVSSFDFIEEFDNSRHSSRTDNGQAYCKYIQVYKGDEWKRSGEVDLRIGETFPFDFIRFHSIFI